MKLFRLVKLLSLATVFTSSALADPKIFLAPSRWDLSNAVAGDSKTPLSQLATTINTALTKSLLNQANGIPILDGSSVLNYPVNAPSVTSTFLASSPTYGGTASSAYRVNLFNTPGNPDTSNLASGMPWQDAFVLGGTQASDKMFRMVYGQPYGGNNAAVVDAVYMNGMSAGQGTGVTAGGFGQMTTYMNYDAAARETRTGSTPPRFIASGAIKDPDGNTHTVTFSATGATFSPALPAYWGRQLRTGMNVGTNMRGVADGVIKQNNWSQPWATTGFRRTYPTYFGTMTSWATNSDGTVPSISVDGWVVFEQANFGLGNSSGKVPGKDTLDGSTPGLDTAFSNISQPAIFFGVYTKAFLEYSLCDLHTDVPYGDINNPNGTIGSQVHECDDERDLWNHDPADYVNSIHGMTYAFDNNGGGKLTLDSYGVGIAGGSALPLGIRAWNLLPGSVAYQSMANAALTQTDIFAPYAPGVNQGDTAVVQSWGMELGEKGVNTSMVRLMQYRDTAITDTMSDNETEQSKVSVHLQWKWDTTPNPLDESGAVGSQVVFNPAGYLYGLGLGAGGTFQNPKYALIIDRLANLWLPNGANISEGNGLGFIPSTGDSQGHAFLTAEDNYHVVLKDSAGGLGGLHVGAFQSDAMFTANNGMNVGQGQGLGFVPSNGDSAGHVYFHPIDNYTLELAATAGGLGQLNVGKLNAAAQIDAYGGVNIWNGQGIGMVPSTGDSQGHPYFSASDSGTVSFKTTTNGWASMLLYGITTQGGSINVSGGQGVGFIPTDGDTNGHTYFAAEDNYHLALKATAGGLGGIHMGSFTADSRSYLNDSLYVMGGKTVDLIPFTGDASGHPFVFADSSSTVAFKTSVGGWANVNVYGITTNGGSVNITGGQGLGLIPDIGDGSGHPYFMGANPISVSLMTSSGRGGLAALNVSQVVASAGILASWMQTDGLGDNGSGRVTVTSPMVTNEAVTMNAGGSSVGMFNGWASLTSLTGSSVSGATTILTGDGSGNLTTNNCPVISKSGVTVLDIIVTGASSNNVDVVQQQFFGLLIHYNTTTNAYDLTNSTSLTRYPSLGSPGKWTATVGMSTNVDGCVSVSASASGTGSWKWKATVRAHYDNF